MGSPVPKILVADDNSNIQKMVALAFEDRGVAVVAVGNGEAAVRRIPELAPDLVLADIFMPVRNGYEVCEFVKKDNRFAHVPVILLVGAFDPLDEREARRVGADGILKKPFVPPDPLIAMVMSALEKNPKVAAELAKAKESKETPEPHPLPRLETPARAKSKTLPQFPEPSPEEAPAAYGFTAGANEPAFTEENADDAEFDGASTSADWRRNSMDFEIPAEAANMPAFSTDDDPQPVAPPQPPPTSKAVPQELHRTIETDAPVHSSPSSEIEDSSHNFFEPEAPSLIPAPVEDAPALPLHEEHAAPSTLSRSPVPDPQPEEEPPSASGQPHWMDSVAASKTEYPHTDWMNKLTEQQENAAPSNAFEHFNVPAPDSTAALTSKPTAPGPSENVAPPAPPGVGSSSETQAHSHDEEPFFADEAAPSRPAHEVFPSEVPGSKGWSPWDAKPFANVAKIDDVEIEPDPDPADEHIVAFKDPALVEPPAVRVIPEPLLLDEEPLPSPEYGSRIEQLQPLHSVLVPEADKPPMEESAESEASAQDEIPAPSFESQTAEVNERIPTAPPPNREALAEVPFLNPPTGFRPDAPAEPAVNSETVDAVVRKVLEKLEPQLHDLLSRGVLKPLVENLLQSEIAKKEK